jgi:hypothetical protein
MTYLGRTGSSERVVIVLYYWITPIAGPDPKHLGPHDCQHTLGLLVDYEVPVLKMSL